MNVEENMNNTPLINVNALALHKAAQDHKPIGKRFSCIHDVYQLVMIRRSSGQSYKFKYAKTAYLAQTECTNHFSPDHLAGQSPLVLL